MYQSYNHIMFFPVHDDDAVQSNDLAQPDHQENIDLAK